MKKNKKTQGKKEKTIFKKTIKKEKGVYCDAGTNKM